MPHGGPLFSENVGSTFNTATLAEYLNRLGEEAYLTKSQVAQLVAEGTLDANCVGPIHARLVYNDEASATISQGEVCMQDAASAADPDHVIKATATIPRERLRGVALTDILANYAGWVGYKGVIAVASDGGVSAGEGVVTDANARADSGAISTNEHCVFANALEDDGSAGELAAFQVDIP